MSQKHILPKPIKVSATPSNSLAIRLVIASVIFAVALILKMPAFVDILLLIISAALAGYDIALKAISAFESGDYLDVSVTVVVIAALSFIIGFAVEGTALVLLYQIGTLLLKFARDHTRKTALDMVHELDEETLKRVEEVTASEEGTSMAIENVMRVSAGTILRLAMLIAVVYAIVLPLATSFSFRVSIHRALMILMIATPMSVIVSIPVAAIVGICAAARQGVVFQNAYGLEAMADAGAAVFDKNGIFTEECPRIIAMHSSVLDQDTFLNFAAHAVYYSEQPVANAIAAVFDKDYKLEVIKDFREIPGYGVELSIDGIPVAFATGEYFRKKGVALTEEESAVGQTFYMVVAGRELGKVVISSDANQGLEDLVPKMKAAGISRCVLLTEDGREVGQQFAETMNFSEMYSECTPERKLQILSELAKKTKGAVLYVYANSMGQHSDAAIDIRVSKRAKYADATAEPDLLHELPGVKQIAGRMREICIENALFAFIVKALLIFLSILGYCNLWLAVFLDFAAAVATVMNTIRITGPSLRETLRYKMGRS